jgi:hypothetical protein
VRRSQTCRRRAHLLLLHPLFPLPAPLSSPSSSSSPFRPFTDTYTSARGHQGEDPLPHSSVDAPAFEPRGNTVSATVPPRTLLVMPVPPPSPSHAQPRSWFCFLTHPSRSASADAVLAAATGLATVSTRSTPVPAHAHAHPCTPALARARSP